MAQFVGDLVPRGSGTASLGVDQIGFGGFNHEELFPFAHIHCNSGILHDPMMGTSGVLRFREGRSYDKLQFCGADVGVGANFGYIPRVTCLIDGVFDLHVPTAANIITGTELRLESPEIEINGDNILRLSTSGVAPIILSAAEGGIVATAKNTVQFLSSNSDVQIGAQGNVILSAFGSTTTNGSGNLRYLFGPNEAWHTYVGAGNNDFVPIPHSGHVLQMILENAGGVANLQEAYEAGPNLSITGFDLTVNVDDATLALGTLTCDNPPLVVSGITTLPQDTRRYGVTMMTHGQLGRNAGLGVNDSPAAKSLGIDTLAVTTGSGIITLAHTSGIQEFSNGVSNQTFTAVDPSTNKVLANNRGYQRDQYMSYDSSSTGVRIFVPGLYRVHGSVTTSTTGGANTHNVYVDVDGTRVSAKSSIRAINGVAGGIGFSALVHANARSLISIDVSKASAAGTAIVVARGVVFWIEYVGPKRN